MRGTPGWAPHTNPALRLVGPLDLGEEVALCRTRAGLAAAGAAQDPGGPDGEDGSHDRPCDVDPVVAEVLADEVGPNVRAGFIEAPEIGLPQRPARAM